MSWWISCCFSTGGLASYQRSHSHATRPVWWSTCRSWLCSFAKLLKLLSNGKRVLGCSGYMGITLQETNKKRVLKAFFKMIFLFPWWCFLGIKLPSSPTKLDTLAYSHMDVSKNSGTPKSSILIGFSILNHPFWGFPLIFGNTHINITQKSFRWTL